MEYRFEYETQGAATFLIYEKKPEDAVDSMTMGMISNNRIEGVLPFIHVQIDGTSFFKYNVSSYNTLEQFFSGIVTKKRFLKVMENLLNGFILAEEYMLETSAMILDPSYIFVNPNTSETFVVVLPIAAQAGNSVEDFMRSMVFRTQFDQSEDCAYIAALINFLNSNQFFSIHKYRELVQDLLLEKKNVQITQMETPKAETVIPKEKMPEQLTFTEVEKTVLNTGSICSEVQSPPVESQAEEAIQIREIPSAENVQKLKKKEKKSLFGRKDKEKTNEKEKKSLFGKKEKETVKKKRDSRPIPGMAIPGMAIPEEKEIKKVISDTEGKTRRIDSQSLIPVQEIKMRKHSVPTQDFGDTVDLRSFSEGTTLLNEGTTVLVNPVSKKRFFLKRIQTGEVFEIKSNVTRIGKDAVQSEICIQGNSAVSRVHAAVYLEKEQLYIQDMNSTNGTYVEGMKLQSGSRSEALSNGTYLRLGNEDLEIMIQN